MQELMPASGLFGQEVWLGDRPPTLPDYLDDSVAATVSMPATQKLIVISAVETMVSG